ncbi:SPOSA6832_01764 [Sporobolomyces salmonicolor]|uniref:SPOSA6832_01764-mRNA-1:cds n=1 Tax=Sporidiobolus salmonicolor TaxID=5005 RepID=A0A0D6EJM5_SPOSA|nr:SPOSA6832_01764 [Sporobolomyces salmonicolor]
MSPLSPSFNDSTATKSDDSLTEEQRQTLAEKRLVRKVDWLLMPLLTVSMGLQYYDKAVLGSASVFGIIKDLGLSTTHIDSATGKAVTSTLRYSTANSAFYWGFFWGVTVILTVVVTSYEGLVVQRVFLGVLESSVSPGFVMITTQWYKKSEQAARLGIWYSATGIFSAFSGVVNYGLGSAGGSLATWKYMYLFAGAWTILWSLVVLLVVPDSPRTSQRWFNDQEREILMRRSRENMSGRVELGSFSWGQAREAALDLKIWGGGVTAFGARIVSSFGYDSLTTIAIQIPGGAFTCVSIYLFTYLAGKWKNSLTWLIPLSCLPVVTGAAIIWGASWKYRGVPLFGYYLLPCFGAPYVLLLALSAQNVAGSTKKALSAGAIFVGYNVGKCVLCLFVLAVWLVLIEPPVTPIIGPYLVFTEEKPIKYRSTWISIIVCMGVTSGTGSLVSSSLASTGSSKLTLLPLPSSLISLLLRVHLSRQNRARDAAAAAAASARLAPTDTDEKSDELDGAGPGADAQEHERIERDDLTDWENARFRYSL